MISFLPSGDGRGRWKRTVPSPLSTDTTEWNEFDFDLAVCPISSVELMPSLPTTPVRQHSNPGPVSPGP